LFIGAVRQAILDEFNIGVIAEPSSLLKNSRFQPAFRFGNAFKLVSPMSISETKNGAIGFGGL